MCDDYVRELQEDHATAVWVAELSDGSTVYMDDGRPGVTPHSAWLRLAGHLAKSGLGIRELWLKFRSNELRILPSGAAGYFFSKSVVGLLYECSSLSFYLMGVLTGDKVVVQRI